MIDPKTLTVILRYEPDTGKLFWLERPASLFNETAGRSVEHAALIWNTKFAGRETFKTLNEHGYPCGHIFNRPYKAHRVIWAIVHGQWPAFDIDHINGVRNDNRLVNLRAVTRLENTRNAAIQERNSSGVIGVLWRSGKWRAKITDNGKQIHIGTFDNLEDAKAARKAAEIAIGYHPGHGRKGNAA